MVTNLSVTLIFFILPAVESLIEIFLRKYYYVNIIIIVWTSSVTSSTKSAVYSSYFSL